MPKAKKPANAGRKEGNYDYQYGYHYHHHQRRPMRGPASRYAVSADGHGWESGKKIIPLSEDKARKWAEEHLDVDEYEEIFGEVQE